MYLQHQLEAELIACCSAILLLSSMSRGERAASPFLMNNHLLCQSPSLIDFGIPRQRDGTSSKGRHVEKKRKKLVFS